MLIHIPFKSSKGVVTTSTDLSLPFPTAASLDLRIIQVLQQLWQAKINKRDRIKESNSRIASHTKNQTAATANRLLIHIYLYSFIHFVYINKALSRRQVQESKTSLNSCLNHPAAFPISEQHLHSYLCHLQLLPSLVSLYFSFFLLAVLPIFVHHRTSYRSPV